jgi:hypothetical protein
MSVNPDDSSEWLPCPAGLLGDAGVRARSRRQMRLIAQLATASLLLILVGIGSWFLLREPVGRENHFGGIACSEVSKNMEAFMAGTLPDSVAAKIRAHLDQCPNCQKMMQNTPKTRAAAWFPVQSESSGCMCEACQCDRIVARVPRNTWQPRGETLAALATIADK